ncbi:MAG: ABC transporter permease [Chloroflexi bacterium]|nr:ABC transporter permease [Chloroflexota bacterium]
MRAVLALAAMELRLVTRRGEGVLVTMVLPVVLLLFLGSTALFAQGAERPIDFLTPGILALAIMSTGMVSLGIATAYERHYGVLKRLGGTPLTRGQLVAAKLLAVLAIEAVQMTLIAGIAAAVFDWRLVGNPLVTMAVALLGTVAFASLGLALAGSLRAEAVLALANGLYLVFLLVGGLFVPISHLPAAVAAVAPWLPAAALADALRAAVSAGPLPWGSLAVLAAWAVGGAVLATRTFRWE